MEREMQRNISASSSPQTASAPFRQADSSKEPVLVVRDLNKVFHRKGEADNVAVDEVTFTVRHGECVGLVGESGSGKSTIANMIMRFQTVSAGGIVLDGIDVAGLRGKDALGFYQHVQIVFQNPEGSFDPRRTLADGIGEGLRNQGISKSKVDCRVAELLLRCGLSVELGDRYPRQVSGGQCQRAAIARALALEPSLLICDESTSALDMTVQKQVIALLGDIRRHMDMAMLFICHDIALVQEICDSVLVIQKGRIVEQGSADSVLQHPQHPYTQQLISAIL